MSGLKPKIDVSKQTIIPSLISLKSGGNYVVIKKQCKLLVFNSKQTNSKVYNTF